MLNLLKTKHHLVLLLIQTHTSTHELMLSQPVQ